LIADSAEVDDAIVLPTLVPVLPRLEFECVHTWPALLDALPKRRWDALLISRDLPGFDLTQVLRLLEEVAPRMVVILVSGGLSEGGAVAAMRAGASDCVLTSELERLIPALELGLRKAERARRTLYELRARAQGEPELAEERRH
jgi:DNA-binding NtrC family response regulator